MTVWEKRAARIKELIDKQKPYPNWPGKVIAVYSHRHYKIPMGITFYQETLAEFPEYFPEETVNKEIMASIPKEVHDNFEKEYNASFDEYWNSTETPEEINGKGIMAFINWQEANPEEAKKHEQRRRHAASEKHDKQVGLLRKKYYLPYGIPT